MLYTLNCLRTRLSVSASRLSRYRSASEVLLPKDVKVPQKYGYRNKAGQGRRHHDPSDGAGVRRIAETPLSSCQPEGEEANPGRVLRDDENAPEVGDQAAQRGARPEGRGAWQTAALRSGGGGAAGEGVGGGGPDGRQGPRPPPGRTPA